MSLISKSARVLANHRNIRVRISSTMPYYLEESMRSTRNSEDSYGDLKLGRL